MCLQCLVNPISFGEPLPGFFLMRARRNNDAWGKGDWALVECNDPTFIWKDTPIRIKEFWDVPDRFYNSFDADPMTGYRLVQASVVKGYDVKTPFIPWLFNYLANWIEAATITEQGDPFPHLEEISPSDLTIGKDPMV